MEFTLKAYKLSKIKNYFKEYHFFFIYNTFIQKNDIKITQELKKLNLKSSKLYNTLTKLILKKSIYQKYLSIIRGLVSLMLPKTFINLTTLAILSETVTLLGLKINNKIYSKEQISFILKFDYSTNLLNLTKTFHVFLSFIKLFNNSQV